MADPIATPPATDIRPIVAGKASNRAPWLFGGLLVVLAASLFGALEARRATISSPRIAAPRDAGDGVIASPPELAIPPDFAGYQGREIGRYPVLMPAPNAVGNAPAASRPSAPAAPGYSVRGNGNAGQAAYPTSPAPPYSVGPAYPYPAPPSLGAGSDPANGDGAKEPRVRASRLRNPATTVPQGTVIQAVLETALDSNHPGFARGIISRDVSSFDGSRILIPKGSKLFGEYKADISRGQNRALIQWHRLTRPDGAIIDVDSPTADPLGRAGVKGKVNSHFLQRFSGAILQSALDVGVQLAARKATDNTVILALPNSSQAINPIRPDDIRPTLTVRQGTSVSVFVARDLDFTDVEG